MPCIWVTCQGISRSGSTKVSKSTKPFSPTIDISTIGDAETKMIVVEYGLEVSNEAAHGVVADLTTS